MFQAVALLPDSLRVPCDSSLQRSVASNTTVLRRNDPQPLYLQSGTAFPVPLPTWYLMVENSRVGGTNPPQWCLIKMKRSPTSSVDLVFGSGDPKGGFKACRAWHEAISADLRRKRLAQTGERGGN